MPTEPRTDALLHTGDDLAAVAERAVAAGEAALFTRASPERPGGNEDGLALFPVGPDALVLVVADGMGGARSGALASKLAIEAIGKSLGAAQQAGQPLRVAILDGIEAANRAVCALGVGAATTLCVAEVDGDVVRPYHVGDSAILLIGQRGRIKLRTTSHSPVGFAVEAGVLDAQDALHHQDLHIVSNAIGAEDMRIEVGSARPMARRDTLLLATDGLTDNLHLDEIVQALRCGPLERGVRALVDAATSRMEGGRKGEPCKPDDLTLLAFRRARPARS